MVHRALFVSDHRLSGWRWRWRERWRLLEMDQGIVCVGCRVLHCRLCNSGRDSWPPANRSCLDNHRRHLFRPRESFASCQSDSRTIVAALDNDRGRRCDRGDDWHAGFQRRFKRRFSHPSCRRRGHLHGVRVDGDCDPGPHESQGEARDGCSHLEITEIAITCHAVARKTRTVPLGESACSGCGLRFSIKVDEPRCPKRVDTSFIT